MCHLKKENSWITQLLRYFYVHSTVSEIDLQLLLLESRALLALRRITSSFLFPLSLSLSLSLSFPFSSRALPFSCTQLGWFLLSNGLCFHLKILPCKIWAARQAGRRSVWEWESETNDPCAWWAVNQEVLAITPPAGPNRAFEPPPNFSELGVSEGCSMYTRSNVRNPFLQFFALPWSTLGSTLVNTKRPNLFDSIGICLPNSHFARAVSLCSPVWTLKTRPSRKIHHHRASLATRNLSPSFSLFFSFLFLQPLTLNF